MSDERRSSPPLRVIISADDFGLALPINEGVEQAHREGVLTSAGLMVAGDAVTDAVDRARRLPALRVGLHLVVVDGRPVLSPPEVPALVDARGRLSDRLVWAGFRYFLSPAARRQLRSEVRAQLNAFRQTGLVLDHVDTHHHLILHPTVASIVLALAPEFGVRAVRVPAEPWRATRGEGWSRRLEAGLRSVALAPWLALLRWRLRRAGVRYNADVRGLAQTGRMDEATVLRLIETLDRDGTEIFFHPATASPSPTPLPQPAAAHVAELDALCSPRVRSALEARGAVLVGFGDLHKSG